MNASCFKQNQNRRALWITGWMSLLLFAVVACDGAFDTASELVGENTEDEAATNAPDSDDAVTAQNSIDVQHTEAPTEPTPLRTIPEECQAPDRTTYMSSFGVTMDDDDLTDPNVVAAKSYTNLFIFDKSGSMQNSWNGDGGSKWSIARDTMIAAVTPYQQYITAGAIFFSLSFGADPIALIDSGLQINYASGSDFLDVWDENMGMYAAGGGTPLMNALEAANDAIAYACMNGFMEKPFKVVLLTDGMPDYWDAQRGLQLVKSWYDHGIPTTVVGMPGSSAASALLSDIANVGSGGNIEADGTVEGGTAEEIVYTETSTTSDFENDMLILLE